MEKTLPIVLLCNNRIQLQVFSDQLAAAAGDAVDEDDDYSLVVSRGRDILSSTQTQVSELLCVCEGIKFMYVYLYVCLYIYVCVYIRIRMCASVYM